MDNLLGVIASCKSMVSDRIAQAAAMPGTDPFSTSVRMAVIMENRQFMLVLELLEQSAKAEMRIVDLISKFSRGERLE